LEETKGCMGEERAETPNRNLMTYVRERWTSNGSGEIT